MSGLIAGSLERFVLAIETELSPDPGFVAAVSREDKIPSLNGCSVFDDKPSFYSDYATAA